MAQIFTDCETGAIPPLRRWKDVPVLMDASMSNVRELVFQAGTHEDAIRLQLEDWLTLVTFRAWSSSQSRSIPRARRLSQAAKTWGLHVRIAGRNHRLKNRSARAASRGADRAESRW